MYVKTTANECKYQNVEQYTYKNTVLGKNPDPNLTPTLTLTLALHGGTRGFQGFFFRVFFPDTQKHTHINDVYTELIFFGSKHLIFY